MSSEEEESMALSQADKRTIREIVKIILMLDHSKKPIKHSDIFANLSSKPNRKVAREAFEEARKALLKMGMHLEQTDHSSVKSYILVSTTFPLPNMHKVASSEEVASRTLLIIVLAYIFMKDELVLEDELLGHLKQLKIYSENSPVHRYFGDVKKKIFTEFVEQLYLSSKKVEGKESNELCWGLRAHLEVSKKSILEFVCQYGYSNRIKPKDFVSHHQKITEEQGLKNVAALESQDTSQEF